MKQDNLINFGVCSMPNDKAQNFYLETVFTFFSLLRASLQLLSREQNNELLVSVGEKLFNMINMNLGSGILQDAIFNLAKDRKEEGTRIPVTAQVSTSLRSYLKQNTSFRTTYIKLKEFSKQFRILRFFALRLQKKMHVYQTETLKKLFNFSKIMIEASDEQLRVISAYIVSQKQDELMRLANAAEKFNQEYKSNPKKYTLVSSLFGTTWAPSFSALAAQGWEGTALLQGDIKESNNYAVMPTTDMPITEAHFSSFLGGLIYMASLDNAPILLSGEAYYYAAWDAENALVMYLVTEVVVKTVKQQRSKFNQNLFYLLYDGLKPLNINCREVKASLSEFYSAYMNAPDKIIYNSNGPSFIEYINNVYKVNAPTLFFPRYSAQQRRPKERLGFGVNGDEFHMVCITTCLDQSKDGARDTAPEILRKILHQGIHFHYYHSHPKNYVDDFIKSIQPEYRDYFHTHPVDRDQASLVDELHQYHLGINPSDYFPIMQGVCAFEDRKYADAQCLFVQSTFPTSAMVYAAAGLPMTLPRMLFEVNSYFHETVLPLVFSEFSGLKEHLKQKNLQILCERADRLKQLATADEHISELSAFIRTAVVTQDNLVVA